MSLATLQQAPMVAVGGREKTREWVCDLYARVSYGRLSSLQAPVTVQML
jgi:hypothetical protein